jgi:hypothetical protein
MVQQSYCDYNRKLQLHHFNSTGHRFHFVSLKKLRDFKILTFVGKHCSDVVVLSAVVAVVVVVVVVVVEGVGQLPGVGVIKN